jgi:hypothetical protein
MDADTDFLAEQLKLITKEAEALRKWLDFLDRDIAGKGGVISAVVLHSINESCMKLLYGAGMVNGATLNRSAAPLSPQGGETNHVE